MNREQFDRIYPTQLTPRQNEVLIPFLQGKIDKQIAQEIEVNNPSTVAQHIASIAKTFSIETNNKRSDLIALFIKHRPQMVCPKIMERHGYNPLTFPDKPEPANSYFYIDRNNIESKCLQQLKEAGSLLRIKAPQQMGKTSLLHKIISEAKQKQYHTIFLDFKILETTKLANETLFLKTFYAWTTSKLDSPPPLKAWDEQLPIMESCTAHFKAILKQLDRPLVLVIDNLDRIFNYPQTYENFLPMLRYWHDLANENDTWMQLRLVIAYRTEDYGKLDLNQSPFNVGLPINVREFNDEEIEQLRNRHYGLEAKIVQPLITLIGGHPSLIRLAFYHLATEEFTLEQILANATSHTGIYKNHFRNLVANFHECPKLQDILSQIVSQQSLEITGRNNQQIYQLEAMGIIKLQGNLAVISRQIYQDYFTNYFQS